MNVNRHPSDISEKESKILFDCFIFHLRKCFKIENYRSFTKCCNRQFEELLDSKWKQFFLSLLENFQNTFRVECPKRCATCSVDRCVCINLAEKSSSLKTLWIYVFLKLAARRRFETHKLEERRRMSWVSSLQPSTSRDFLISART
jgi:hypothetical protein